MRTPSRPLVPAASLSGLAALALLAFLATSCSQPAEAPADVRKPGQAPADVGTIKIGEYGSLTGSTATFGQSTKMGVELAIDEINAAGGVKGRKLEVLVEDDQGKPEEAANVVTKLINQDKVVAVIGEVASSRTLAAAPIAQQAGVPMITPSSTNETVTLTGDYIFRVCFNDPFQGEVCAKFAHDNLNAKRAAILKDIRNDYSVGLAKSFTDTFTALGGTISTEVAYSEGDKDFRGQLTQVKASKPDIIFVPGYYTEAGLIAQQAKEQGITQPLLGGDGWESPKLLEIGGAALEGSYYCNHYFAGAPIPRIQEFVAKFKTKFNEEPDSIAALAYDATKVLAAAMGRTANLDKKDIRDQIAATKDFEAVTGTINFDANRNPVKPAVMLKVEGGKITYVTEVGGAAPAAPETPAAPAPADGATAASGASG